MSQLRGVWGVIHTKEVFTSVHKYKTALGGLRTNTRMLELPDDIFMPDLPGECAKKYSSVTFTLCGIKFYFHHLDYFVLFSYGELPCSINSVQGEITPVILSNSYHVISHHCT